MNKRFASSVFVFLVAMFMPVSASAERGRVLISEICFYPELGQPQWIELLNAGDTVVGGAALSLMTESGRTPLPDSFRIDPGSYALIQFDQRSDVSSGKEPAAVHLHRSVRLGAPDGFAGVYLRVSRESVAGGIDIVVADHGNGELATAMAPLTATGQAAAIVGEVDEISDFVAWGKAPGEAAADAEEKRMWDTSSYLFTDPAPDKSIKGPNPDDLVDRPGMAIGRNSGMQWMVYRSTDTTPGHANKAVFYPPKVISPSDGGWSDSCPVFWWASRAPITEIEFSASPDFSHAIASARVTDSQSQLNACPNGLEPAKKIFWRLRGGDEAGLWSEWSSPQSFRFDNAQAPFL